MVQSDHSLFSITPPPFPASLPCGTAQLRRFTAADAPSLLAAGADPGILAFTSLDAMTTVDEIDTWLANREAEEAAGGGLSLAIAEDGAALGAVLLLHHDLDAATAELGYWLLAPARGRGLATQALRALRDWCCEAGYQRISLVANLDNQATHRVARRCEFQAEGVLRSYGFDRSGVREDVVSFAYVAPGHEAQR